MSEHRQEIPKKLLHFLSVQPSGAVQQFGGSIMCAAPRAGHTLEARDFPEPERRSHRVVQMNVRQQNRIQVSDAKMVQGELLAQCAERRARPGSMTAAKCSVRSSAVAMHRVCPVQFKSNRAEAP